jgi:hypothetical protein
MRMMCQGDGLALCLKGDPKTLVPQGISWHDRTQAASQRIGLLAEVAPPLPRQSGWREAANPLV